MRVLTVLPCSLSIFVTRSSTLSIRWSRDFMEKKLNCFYSIFFSSLSNFSMHCAYSFLISLSTTATMNWRDVPLYFFRTLFMIFASLWARYILLSVQDENIIAMEVMWFAPGIYRSMHEYLSGRCRDLLSRYSICAGNRFKPWLHRVSLRWSILFSRM